MKYTFKELRDDFMFYAVLVPIIFVSKYRKAKDKKDEDNIRSNSKNKR